MKEMAESQPFSLFSMRDFWDSLADSFARRDVKHRLLIHRQLEHDLQRQLPSRSKVSAESTREVSIINTMCIIPA